MNAKIGRPKGPAYKVSTFKIDLDVSDTLERRVRWGERSKVVNAAMRKYFTSMGVDFNAPKSPAVSADV